MRIEKNIILVIGIFIFLFILSSPKVFAEEEILQDLSIICPFKVNESFTFDVTIKSNNLSLANATVIFNGKINITNTFGKVSFTAPRVLPEEDNTYSINALKDGYNKNIVNITVVNVPQVFPNIKSLNIVEKTIFIVSVIDDEGRIIDNATITFNGKEYFINVNGTVSLTAPSVNKSKVFVISANKLGYIDYSIFITIYPDLSPENLIGFFIVIFICILIVVLTVIIMLRKYLKRKRINRI